MPAKKAARLHALREGKSHVAHVARKPGWHGRRGGRAAAHVRQLRLPGGVLPQRPAVRQHPCAAGAHVQACLSWGFLVACSFEVFLPFGL
eukprot:scaffold184757_cov18-Tisochrysis_lutea.AAC.1